MTFVAKSKQVPVMLAVLALILLVQPIESGWEEVERDEQVEVGCTGVKKITGKINWLIK